MFFFEETRKIVCCICILICISPILIGIGLWELFSAPFDNARQNKINAMNNAIYDWNTIYRNQFMNKTISAWTEDTSIPTILQPSTSSDFYPDGNTNLDSYVPLKYTIPRNTLIRDKTGYKDGTPYTFYFGLPDKNITVTTIMFKTVVSFGSCENPYGLYNSTTKSCTTHFTFGDISIKVSQISGVWDADATYGDIGTCYNNGIAGMNWNPASYHSVPYQENTFSYSSVSITVRYKYDPFIFAQYETDGTMDFGLTKTERALIGIILISIGGCCLLPCFCLIVLFFCTRSRREGYRSIVN